jgi:hypothetical protein
MSQDILDVGSAVSQQRKENTDAVSDKSDQEKELDHPPTISLLLRTLEPPGMICFQESVYTWSLSLPRVIFNRIAVSAIRWIVTAVRSRIVMCASSSPRNVHKAMVKQSVPPRMIFSAMLD